MRTTPTTITVSCEINVSTIYNYNCALKCILCMAAGDAKNEVPITNVAKIEYPGSPRKKSASGNIPYHYTIRID